MKTEDDRRGLGRILRLPEVCNRVGLSKSQIYALMARKEFPQRLRLTTRTSGWIEAEVNDWIATRQRVGGSDEKF